MTEPTELDRLRLQRITAQLHAMPDALLVELRREVADLLGLRFRERVRREEAAARREERAARARRYGLRAYPPPPESGGWVTAEAEAEAREWLDPPQPTTPPGDDPDDPDDPDATDLEPPSVLWMNPEDADE